MAKQRAARGDQKADAARLLHAATRERVAVATDDLFLPESLGLSERHRATMTSLLARLIRAIEDDLRLSLAAHFEESRHPAVHASLSSVRIELALPILASSLALRDPDLISLLLRRVEEDRVHRMAQLAPRRAGRSLLEQLVRDRDEEVANAAMAILIAQTRRLDRFQEPVIVSPELPAEIEHRLVWTVAAALRVYLITRQNVEPADADQALASAAQDRLAVYDESEGLEARCLQLARRLNALGKLDDSFLSRAVADGSLPLLLAALAVRCTLSYEAAWEVMSDPRGEGPAFLLRACDLGRDQAAPILEALAGSAPPGTEDMLLVRQVELFDRLTAEEARGAITLWQVDPAYRAAVARVSSRRMGNNRG